jgi:hypothetical protein
MQCIVGRSVEPYGGPTRSRRFPLNLLAVQAADVELVCLSGRRGREQVCGHGSRSAATTPYAPANLYRVAIVGTRCPASNRAMLTG